MKIGIVGLGLIGGSILKSLYGKGFELYSVTRNKQTVEAASVLCQNISSDISILKDCNIVFVAVPMSNVLETLEKLNGVLSEKTLVTDVSSLKEFVMRKKYSFKFIGSHPMAGTENSGYEASFAELFQGAKWVLTPYYDTLPQDGKKLEEVISKMGAKVVYADAKEHDEAVAKISHMPMLIAQAIFKTAQENELAMQIASSGFRDMTRLAMSNPEMADDMIQMNADNIQTSILKLYKTVGDLTKSNYLEQINEIKSKRRLMKF